LLFANKRITATNVELWTGPVIRIRTPAANSISIMLPTALGPLADKLGTVGAIATAAKPIASAGAGLALAPPVKTPRRARPRHECSRLGWTSYRRATSATFASGASVSSTRRSFSAVVHRRRRSGPESTVAVICFAH
jgi:hypothetical protein